MLYRVTSFAYDPASGTRVLHERQPARYRDLMARRRRRRASSACCSRTRASARSSFNPTDRSLLGVRHADGLATLVRDSALRTTRGSQVHTFPYGVVPYDLDISPDGRLLSASVAEVERRPVPARVGARRRARAAT